MHVPVMADCCSTGGVSREGRGHYKAGKAGTSFGPAWARCPVYLRVCVSCVRACVCVRARVRACNVCVCVRMNLLEEAAAHAEGHTLRRVLLLQHLPSPAPPRPAPRVAVTLRVSSTCLAARCGLRPPGACYARWPCAARVMTPGRASVSPNGPCSCFPGCAQKSAPRALRRAGSLRRPPGPARAMERRAGPPVGSSPHPAWTQGRAGGGGRPHRLKDLDDDGEVDAVALDHRRRVHHLVPLAAHARVTTGVTAPARARAVPARCPKITELEKL